MGKQSDAFLFGEGDAWYERNKNKDHKDDPVLRIVDNFRIIPKSVLEVGCSNGWRLLELKNRYNCKIEGIEPSDKAKGIYDFISSGTAVDITRFNCWQEFDLVIFGFCMYLVDREDLMDVVGQVDNVLQDNGHVIIYDFWSLEPYCLPYEHKEGLFSYKQDYSLMFVGNPAYRLIHQCVWGNGDDKYAVSILRKNLKAWPLIERMKEKIQ